MRIGPLLIAALLLASGAAHAAKRNYAGELRARNEVTKPDLTRDAGGPDFRPYGEIEATYDDETKELCGRFVRLRDLSGAPTGVHVHQAPQNQPEADGPADRKFIIPPGAAPVLFNVKLDDLWENSLVRGEVYGNVHTAKNPKGEIRGTLYAYDFGTEEEPFVKCPPPTQPPPAADAGPPPPPEPSDAGPPPPTDTTDPPDDTDPPEEDPPRDSDAGEEPAPKKEEAGCNVTGGASGLPLAFLAALGFVVARRRRAVGRS